MFNVHKLGDYRVSFSIGKIDYGKPLTLEESIRGEYKIVKQVSKNFEQKELLYSMLSLVNNKELSFIRGYLREPENFFIKRIKSLAQDRISGSKNLPPVFEAMERDLIENEVKSISAATYLWFAPIAMKKFGFYASNGVNRKEIKKKWFQRITWQTIKLEKKLK